jgi:hypothetical protein
MTSARATIPASAASSRSGAVERRTDGRTPGHPLGTAVGVSARRSVPLLELAPDSRGTRPLTLAGGTRRRRAVLRRFRRGRIRRPPPPRCSRTGGFPRRPWRRPDRATIRRRPRGVGWSRGVRARFSRSVTSATIPTTVGPSARSTSFPRASIQTWCPSSWRRRLSCLDCAPDSNASSKVTSSGSTTSG